jgi:ribosome-associated translation inhibitor RaiA
MRLPLQITFRHVDASPSVEDRIREYARELDRFFDQIMSCRVAVERQHRRYHQGNLFRVRLDITVPGREIVVGRESKPRRSHQDISVAIRDAFAAARRPPPDRGSRTYSSG